MTIDFGRFRRALDRCDEVANESGMNPVVLAVYQGGLLASRTAYVAAETNVESCMVAFAKENKESLSALVLLDSPYRVARSSVRALYPETAEALPETLKSASTDTDKLRAITKLLDIIDDYAGQTWADALLTGEFGVKAAAAIKEINEAIVANKALSAAENERAALFGPTYEKYMGFKRVVRDALGPASKQYRRIHLRASPGAAALEQEDAAAPVEKGAPEKGKADEPPNP